METEEQCLGKRFRNTVKLECRGTVELLMEFLCVFDTEVGGIWLS